MTLLRDPAIPEESPNQGGATGDGGVHLDLRSLALARLEGIDEEKLSQLARIVRGLAFAAMDGARSGHPGGSSSKTEMALALLASGVLRFDAVHPKHPGRDRIVWSAGHCSPLFHALVSLVYECVRRRAPEQCTAPGATLTFPEHLARFRRLDGPSGHVESEYPLADVCTGSSGHGIPAALGLAALHRSCGLPTRVFTIAGDAETEEGMTYEARNVAARLGVENLIVALDYNTFGIDGSITEAMPAPYVNLWAAFGWNVIEADGHNFRELVYAYRAAATGFGNGRPTVIVCHTLKGKGYGKLEGTADSHGTPLDHAGYVQAMQKLGFEVSAEEGHTSKDIEAILASLGHAEVDYLIERLDAARASLPSEPRLVEVMKNALGDRPMTDYRTIARPDVLPPELVFKEGDRVPTRKATEAWFAWMMRQTGFFYAGAGDLAKSILTGKAEQVYGLMSGENRLGRGIRFGIAEQNMAMMCVTMAGDCLPGGFRPMTAFASYGVFSVMMANAVRMALISNQVNPNSRGFFILLAAHDGPETGEDGPTHHGLFWMSLYSAYPGIKVYKPLDANEAVEMLFHAASRGEPVAFSVVRPPVPVFKRGDGVPPAREAIHGAYVFRQYSNNGKPKLPIAVCGGQMMANVLATLPDFESDADIKVIAVTSPELFEELRQRDPRKADEILSHGERASVLAFHNGWKGFLYPFLLPADYPDRAFGMDGFLRSGRPEELYASAGYDPIGIRDRIASCLRQGERWG
ncbi:MAG: 1-deoxy-D-xylulose-5-phosphate synthase N-terminal domain-containing protein [Bryobacteraceae bacterium]|jgi:transketolase